MFDHKRYEQVFGGVFPRLGRNLSHELENYRKSLDGALFIDRVLRALGIAKAKIYPPKSETGLKNLHKEVCESTMTMHHRLSIFYYVLLDVDQAADNSDASSDFIARSGIPHKYQIFMKGLWYLDRHQFSTALEYISHPSLISDFADDIIIALATLAPDGETSLLLAYYYAVQPTVKSSRALSLLFEAMAATDIHQALHYTRTFPEPTRRILFHQLVTSVLKTPEGLARGERATILVGLPLTAPEEAWFEAFLAHGEGRSLRKANDTLLMRRITTGQYKQAVDARSVDAHWGVIVEGLKNGLGGR